MRLFLDSTGDPSVLIPIVEKALGRRVDGWIAAVGGEYPCPAASLAWVRNSGRALLCYWEDLTAEEVTKDRAYGVLCGQAALQAAAAAGFPADIRPFVGIEAGWAPSAEFICGLADAGVPGIYGSPYSVALQNAFAAARAANANAAAMVLWSAEPEPGGAPTVPEWGPATCAGAPVDVWQWQENWPVGPGLAIDLDLVRDGYPCWEGLQPGQFNDVAPAAWYAPAVAEAVKAGLMDGIGGGQFAPGAPLTRAQAAALSVRVLAAAKGPAPAAAVRSRRAYGARPSRPRPGLADHRAWTATAAPLPPAYTDPIVASWLPVEDQSQSSMCVAFASTEIRRWWAEKLGGVAAKAPMLSAPYVYARGHQLAGVTAEGMEPVQAMEALHAYGAPPWDADPLQPTDETVSQSIAASPASLDAAAAPYRVPTYGPVDVSDVAAVQRAIMHAPVLIAIPVPLTGGIEDPIPDGQGGWNVLYPPGDPQVIGGHAIMLFGWKTDAGGHVWWLLRNSWGASWASGGNAWIDSAHPIWEMWSFTCAAVSPACLALAQQVASLQQFLAEYPDIPQAHKDALNDAIDSAQAQRTTLGCQ